VTLRPVGKSTPGVLPPAFPHPTFIKRINRRRKTPVPSLARPPVMSPVPGAPRRWLAVEFAALYGAAPLVMAVALPPSMLFPALALVSVLGLVLLALTPGFVWAELVRGARRIGWGFVALALAATAATSALVVMATAPGAFLNLPRNAPGLMLTIALLYPLLSALPQELVFRPLFFRRYGALLPRDPRVSLVVNAFVFSWAHLMFWSWVVGAMTFVGGLAFAWSYRMRGNFPEAVLLHSLAGIVVFAAGLGVFFYSGNVQRPF